MKTYPATKNMIYKVKAVRTKFIKRGLPMIYTVLRENNNETANLFYSWEEYHKATFSPDIETICIIELGQIKGKTYQAKKGAIESKAIEYSNNQAGGLSYGEIADIQGYFETYGKRYGLLRDFRENAIC